MGLEIVVLAAGKGTRMKSDLPKVLHPIAGQPMLVHLLQGVQTLAPEKIHVVIGQGADQVKSNQATQFAGVNWVIQSEQLGTGHALQQALPYCQPDSRVLVLVGDAPLITKQTLAALVAIEAHLVLLTVELDNPQGYGRILRSPGGNIVAIVEEKDASSEQKSVREINTGIMIASAADFSGWLTQLDNKNAQGEYLLTDIVALSVGESKTVNAYISPDEEEVMGINDMRQLAMAERSLQVRQAEQLMAEGVRIVDPARFDLRGELKAGKAVTIDINCVFEGQVVLGDGVEIGPNCLVRDCVISDGAVIKANSVLEEAEVGPGSSIGPFARLRPGTHLGAEVSIGNFVEVKKSHIGRGTKASHLSYLGDATLGEGVNVGAGTITCNYDGVNKHQTHIGDNVFIGSNSALVAPVTISDNGYVAAGSTITHTVKEGSLAIARGRQRDIENWQTRKKEPKE